MDATRREMIMQRWNVVQHALLPELREQVGTLMPKLEQVIHIFEWMHIKEFTTASWCGVGRPPHERAWLANAFIAKAVLGHRTKARQQERRTMQPRAPGVSLAQARTAEPAGRVPQPAEGMPLVLAADDPHRPPGNRERCSRSQRLAKLLFRW